MSWASGKKFLFFSKSRYQVNESSFYCITYVAYLADAVVPPFQINSIAGVQKDKKIFAFGPLHPLSFDSTGEPPRQSCLEWLDKQPPSSVLYVSFGTMTSFSDDQIAQLAIALERSGQRFIWILRDADTGDIYKEQEVRKSHLPKGFEDRIQGVGIIVRDWAPQLQILAHSSTGGFLSHFGWNSCIESLSMAVPIAAWPIWIDQPRNALLMTEVLKVGIEAREWAQRDELISSDTIASSIRKLMASDVMRKRAKELGIDVRRAVSEGVPLSSSWSHSLLILPDEEDSQQRLKGFLLYI